ncbi:hypothetical protein IWQ52_004255 [Labrenzia sp. EL_159]|nr:hypothetical protein [Labrenzia sp. EL_162]MBG6196719.1 hypothetical protein [Labrenzia sp. EL_159]
MFEISVSILKESIDQKQAIISIATVFISLISLFMAIYAVYSQRKHDRISVRPFANIFFGDYEDNVFVGIENVGLGPMIIKDIKYSDKDGNSHDALIELMPTLSPGYTWNTYVSDTNDRALAPNTRLKLIQLSGSDIDPLFSRDRDKVRKELDKLILELTYTDIYGINFDRKRKLNWFGRHWRI